MSTTDETRTQRVIDFRLPVPWLVTSGIAIASFMIMLGWQAAGQSNKLDTLIQANTKLEKRLDDRDARLDTLRDSLYAQQRITDNNTLRITSMEARMNGTQPIHNQTFGNK